MSDFQFSGAVFTERLKDVFAFTGGTVEIVDGISVLTGGNIGLNDYPIWTADPSVSSLSLPDYRPILNGMIFDHYQNREIGQESIGMFQLAMRRKMNEIMHIANKMFLSELTQIDPLSTVNLHTDNSANDTQNINNTVSSASSSDAIGKSRNVGSDTPQTMLSEEEDYATTAADVNSENTVNASGSNTTTGTTTDAASGTTATSGYQGSPADLIMRFRQSFINPNMMVISELEECFMQIWDNGDTFTDNGNGSGYLGY